MQTNGRARGSSTPVIAPHSGWRYASDMGRPREFVEESLLDHAQEIFWVRGYDQTKIEDIAAVSGVGNGSIYAAYGSKLGLFLRVFERYCAERVRIVRSIVESHRGGFQSAVAHYLHSIVEDCTAHPDRRGCMMVRSLAELSTRFPEVAAIGLRSTAQMERVLAARIEQARAEGELSVDQERVGPLSAHIVLVSQGLISLSRGVVPASRLHAIAEESSRITAGSLAHA